MTRRKLVTARSLPAWTRGWKPGTRSLTPCSPGERSSWRNSPHAYVHPSCPDVTAASARTPLPPPRVGGADSNSGRHLHEGGRDGVHDGRFEACKTQQGGGGLPGERRLDLGPRHDQDL